jgi:hypothetical protein
MYTFRASIYWEFFLIINLIAISTIFNAGKISAQNTPSNEIPTPEKEADIGVQPG